MGQCQGRVLSAGLAQGRDMTYGTRRIETFVPHVEYSYQVGGISHSGNRISLAVIGDSNRNAARKRISPYKVDSEVCVFYDESDPSSSYLVDPRRHIRTSLLVPAGFALFGIGMIWFLSAMLE